MEETITIKNAGEMVLSKGAVRDNVTFFCFDSVRDCNEDQCRLSDKCQYPKEGKCGVLMQYLDCLYKAILGTYRYLDEAMLFKIGMQIVPLYLMLAKMQMAEMELTSITYVTEKGSVAAEPIYKEIRETMKAIHTMWKDLDLSFSFNGRVDPKNAGSGTAVPDKNGDNERGDPTYAARIQENAARSMKGVVR